MSNAQAIDSLELKLELAEFDTVKINLLLDKASDIKYSDPHNAAKYADRALIICEKNDYKTYSVRALNHLGLTNLILGEHQLSLSNFKKALKLNLTLSDSSRIAVSYNYLGNYYISIGFKDKALEYYLLALNLKEKYSDKKSQSVTLNNIGIIYQYQFKLEKALEFHKRALKINENLNDEKGIANASTNIGTAYFKLKKYEEAIKYTNDALIIFRKDNNLRGIVYCLNQGSQIDLKNGNIANSLKSLYESKEINIQLKDLNQLSETHYYLAETYIAQKKYTLALTNAKESLEYATNSGSITKQVSSWIKISEIYELLNNKKEALIAFKTGTKLNDSLQSTENSQYIEKLQVEYEAELKDNKILLQEQDISILNKDKTLKRQLIIGLLLIVVLISIIFYARYKILNESKKRLKTEVDLKNKELLSFTLQTTQKNELIQQLKEDVTNAFNKLDADHKMPSKSIGNMFRNIHNTERDWEEFKLRFEQVDQDFLQKLKKDYTQLSATDIRICALIRLNLSAKEIAAMLNITQDSVNKSRYRLRKKLELPKEIDLNNFIASI